MLNAGEVCDALELQPEQLSDIFRREIARELYELATTITSASHWTERPTHAEQWQRVSNLLLAVEALEEEWDRRNPEDDASAVRLESSREANLDRDTEGDGAGSAEGIAGRA